MNKFNNSIVPKSASKIEEYFKLNFSLRQIEQLTGVNRKIISIYLKNLGYTVKKHIPNNTPEKQDIYKNAAISYLKGESIKSISKRMHFSPVYFSRWLEQNGLKRPRDYNHNRESKLEIAIELIKMGIPRTKVARIVHINDNELVAFLTTKGIIVKNSTRIQNNSVFENIDTEEKAYWLGFIYADGCVSNSTKYTLEITLKKSDENHLKKFRSFLDSDALISNKTISHGEKVYKAVRIAVHSKKLVEDLISKGCTPRKSLTLSFPSREILPQPLVKHFIRGYFDGDGSITVKCNTANINLLSTKSFLIAVADYYKIPLKLKRHGNAWGLYFAKKMYTTEFLNDIYTDYSVALERKELLALRFLKSNKDYFNKKNRSKKGISS